MRTNKIYPEVPVNIKSYLLSFYQGDPLSYYAGQFIENLIKDYIKRPDYYFQPSAEIVKVLNSNNEKKEVTLTVNLEDSDFEFINTLSKNELRSKRKQAAYALLSIAITLKKEKIKAIIIDDGNLKFKK